MNTRMVLWQDLLDPYHSLSDLLYFDQAIAPGMMMSAIEWYFADTHWQPQNWARTLDLLEEHEFVLKTGSRQLTAPQNYPPEYAYQEENSAAWLRGQYFRSADLQDFLRRVSRPGCSVVPRFTIDQLAERSVNDLTVPLLTLVMERLPSITVETVDPQHFVDFLRDGETRRRKNRLFVWLNTLENDIDQGRLKIQHMPDLVETAISDYRAWLIKADLLIREARREFVFSGLLSALSVVGIPAAAQKYFEFRRKAIEFADDQAAPGREVAHIVYAAETFRA